MKTNLILYITFICFFFPKFTFGKRYNNLPIFAYGIKNSKLTLVIEDEILVQSLTQFPIANVDLFSILPLKDSTDFLSLEKNIKAQSGITLGHLMPYLYIAINHAFDRIYFNSIIKPRTGEDSIRKKMGFDEDLNSDGFNNIREFLSIKEIKDQQLIVEVYSRINSFRNSQGNLKFVSEEAFWDPEKQRIGLYLDPALFYWLPSQVTWQDQTTKETITAIRDYLSKRIIQTISHELVHFIQYVSKSETYKIPFFAEGSAIFLQENIAFREDIFKIAGALTVRKLPLGMPAENSPCKALVDFCPPLSAFAMTKVKNGINVSLQPKFNLENIILMDEKEFYNRSPIKLQELYDISLSFALFAGTIPRDTFKIYFNQFLNGNKLSKKKLLVLNLKYIDWVKNYSEEWWASPDSAKLFKLTDYASIFCLNNRDYVAAYLGSNSLVTFHPNSPMSWIYVGDVFWKVQIPFFSFDYYAKAYAIGRKYGFNNNDELTAMSRLGDAYEALGDIESAVKLYQELRTKNEKKISIEDLIPFLRSNLKEIFYKELKAQNKKQSQIAILLINSYIEVLQLKGCPAEKEYLNQKEINDAIDKNDLAKFESIYRKNFEEIKKRMVNEITSSSNFDEILMENINRCK